MSTPTGWEPKERSGGVTYGRWIADNVALYVHPAAQMWAWSANDFNGPGAFLGGCPFPCETAEGAMNEADLWAADNGFEPVRLEVD